jgi:AcrR family transcriptional regulator
MDKKSMGGGNRRGVVTKARLLEVAEAMIARHGVDGASARAIAIEAGQANHSTIRHHFQSKIDLVRAVLAHRAAEIETRRAKLIAAMPSPLSMRDAVTAIIRPYAAHMENYGSESHYFRFIERSARYFGLAQVAAEAQHAQSLAHCIDRLTGPISADPVRRARGYLVVNLILRSFADREQARAEDMLVLTDDAEFERLLIETAVNALEASERAS